MLKRILTGALFLTLALVASVQGQTTGVRPGFSQGYVTTYNLWWAADLDSVMYLPDERPADSSYVPTYIGGGQLDWRQLSINADTLISGTDTVLITEIVGDTATAIRADMRGEMRDSATVVWNDSIATYDDIVGGIAGDSAQAILATARGEMRDSATAVWADSIGNYPDLAELTDSLDEYLLKASVRDSILALWADSIGNYPDLAELADSLDEYILATTARSNIADSLVAYTNRDSTRNKVLRVNGMADSTANGMTFYGIAGAAMTFGNVVFWRNDSLFLCNGDTTGADYNGPPAAMSIDKTTDSGAIGQFMSFGFARASGWTTLPMRGEIYVDTVAGGQLTRYAPTVAGMASWPVAVSVDSASGRIQFNANFVTTVK
jgi:hypothetical protein